MVKTPRPEAWAEGPKATSDAIVGSGWRGNADAYGTEDTMADRRSPEARDAGARSEEGRGSVAAMVGAPQPACEVKTGSHLLVMVKTENYGATKLVALIFIFRLGLAVTTGAVTKWDSNGTGGPNTPLSHEVAVGKWSHLPASKKNKHRNQPHSEVAGWRTGWSGGWGDCRE